MKSVFGIPALKIAVLCFLVFGVCFSAFAQDLDDVTISGKITDSNGDPIVGAKIEATLVTTGVKRNAATKADGRYRVIELVPGIYRLKVSATGFGDKQTTDLTTISGQNVQLNFSLAPATVTAEQTIDVSGDNAPVIDTTRTIVGGTITEAEIQDLPNASNDVLDLVYSLGGTTEEPLSIRNLASDDRIGNGSDNDRPSKVIGTGSVSLAGGAAYSTNITIDGMDNNDDREAEERFQPPITAVAEVQVITNQFSAEYGRASGGRINIRTKAGGKKFRGTYGLFYEDANLNANTYNNNRRGLSRLPYREWEHQISLSGPIPFSYFKNRTFFQTSYEFRTRDATTQIFTAVPVGVNPLYPLPEPTNPETSRLDLIDGTDLIASYIRQVDTPTDYHGFTGRLDHNFTDTHNITFNYSLGRRDGFSQYRETTRFLEETLQGRTRDTDSFYITDNAVINPNFVNQIRFQYSTYSPKFATTNPDDPVLILRLYDEGNLSEEDRINGSVVVGNSTANFASLREEKRYQFQETANFVVGNFNLRFGTDIQHIKSTTNALSDSVGVFNFNGAEGFLNNWVSQYRRNAAQVSSLTNTYSGFFGQMDWQVRPNLTLGLGLRYERETLIDDNNNFGPRLGIAYSPGESGKSVFRFGAGIFYNRALLRTIDDYSVENDQLEFNSTRLFGANTNNRCFKDPVYAATRDECQFLLFVSRNFPTTPTLDEIRAIPGIGDIERGFSQDEFARRLEDDINIPESYQVNFGYERDLGKAFAFETNFTYNKAVRLWRERNINAFQVPAGFSNFTDYLLSLGDIEIPGTSSGTDIYRFVLGDPTDTNGDINSATGADCTSSTPLCIVNLNTLNGSTSTLEPIGIARRTLLATIGRPITDEVSQIEQVGSIGSSVYEGLSLQLKRRFRYLGKGFSSSMRISYVLSRTRDDGFVDTSSAQVQGDFASEFSRSLTDRRHKLRFSGTVETPNWFGKLRLSPILRLESGRPFNVTIGGDDRNLDDVSTDRPNFSGNLSDLVWHHPNDPFPQALFESFSVAPIGSASGDLPRNAGDGPALFDLDLKVSRNFKIGERFRIQPQATFSNILNATVYSFGTNFIGLDNAGTPEFERGFLTPSRTFSQRKIQLALRIYF